MEQAILLFVLLNLCHFLADYTPLSTQDMLAAKRFGKPVLPIVQHAAVHSMMMFLLLTMFGISGLLPDPPMKVYMAILLQLVSHTLFDTLKGRFAKWIPITADPTQKWYWIVMGFDQFLHQTVIAIMIYLVLR